MARLPRHEIERGYTGGTQEANAGWIYDACPNGLGQLCQEDTIPGGPPNPASLMRVYGYGQYGRPASVTTTIGASVYTSSTTYDQHGRVFQAFDGAEAHSGLQYQYGPYGHREAAIESRGSASVTVERYRITGQDARGQVTGMLKGGIEVNRAYAADTGRLETLYARNAGYVTLQDYAFTFDVLGNLTEKDDLRRSLGESYTYDPLNRLTAVSGSSSLTVAYNGLGNITSKSNVGSYGYQTGGTRPHAVTSAGGVNYTYDANGNQVSGTNGRSVSYAVFNKPVSMSRSGANVTIDYGPNRERFRRIDVQGGSTTTTHYVGSIEKVWRPGGVIQVKRYLDGELIETIEASTRTVEYLLTDHLGSVDVVVNASGSIAQSMAFDPFGRRRSPTKYAALADSAIWSFDTTRTTRGYTFHEQLDPVGLVHMNGRVYDPTLGRFLSADPFVQDPGNTQSLNRYTYVFNNPLSYTDPSGYFSFKKFVGIVVGAAVTWWTGGLASTWGWHAIAGGAFAGASGAFASTVAMGGSVQSAFTSAGYGAIGGAAFGGASKLVGASRIAAHGMAGGIMAELQGGKFGHGFLSAGLTKAANVNDIVGIDESLQGARLMVAAIIGGTISEVTGGNFANGAVTAALAQAVNGERQARHMRGPPASTQTTIPRGAGRSSLQEAERIARRIADEELHRSRTVANGVQGGGHNDLIDAERHARWTYRMTLEIGSGWAGFFATGHEILGALRGQPIDEMQMDLSNNSVGLRAAAKGEGVPSVSTRGLAYIKDGQLVYK